MVIHILIGVLFVCFLNLPYRTHNELLPYICDYVKPLMQYLRRVISFIKGVSNAKNELTELCYKLALNGSGSAISNNVSIISFLWSVPRLISRHIYVQKLLIMMLPYAVASFGIYYI